MVMLMDMKHMMKNDKSKKGQAALDFLMTYGWAIALIVIIAAVLFALGIFDINNFVGNKAVGFSQVAVKGWGLDPAGTFTIKMSNQAGVPISITNVSIVVGNTTAVLAGLPVSSTTGADTAILSTATGAFGAQPTGSSYTAKVTISYLDTNANFPYTTSGTLTGKVA